MAMFPDSGVPPSDARNSLPDVDTLCSQELWYSTSRCQPRFDPAAANAMLAEQMNLVMKGSVQYNCNTLNNVELAVRYLIQRGLTVGTALAGGPFDFTAALDPGLTHYNNFLTIIIVPNVQNQGTTRIDVNGRGLVPLLRSDGQNLKLKDLNPGIPTLISYWNGNWYIVGLANSQVPIVAIGSVDVWIRTDGNDTTGDGSANDPAKAFKTINGAWRAVGNRYAATPTFSINMRLGIPGNYEMGYITNFGGPVSITGDPTNKLNYRIMAGIWSPSNAACLITDSIALSVIGCTIDRSIGGAQYWVEGVRISNGSIYFTDCYFDTSVSNANGGNIALYGNGAYAFNTDTELNGRGWQQEYAFLLGYGGISSGVLPIDRRYDVHVNNIVMTRATFWMSGLSVQYWNNTSLRGTNVTGRKYMIAENSILNMQGNQPPGDQPGVAYTGAQYLGPP